jgi:molybdopterin biosynthesis enzyme
LEQNVSVSVTGKVVNGRVLLPPGTKLPEGAAVKVETLEPVPPNDSLVAAVERLAKPRPHLPADYALNHGHHIRGEPEK